MDYKIENAWHMQDDCFERMKEVSNKIVLMGNALEKALVKEFIATVLNLDYDLLITNFKNLNIKGFSMVVHDYGKKTEYFYKGSLFLVKGVSEDLAVNFRKVGDW